MAKVFHRLVTVEEALEALRGFLSSIRPKIVEVPLSEALGRVLAEDVVALVDYPPFDRSEVDGYAVRSSDTTGADEDKPVKLRLASSVEVGKRPTCSVKPGTCVEVSTGAMIPRGADAVVPVEYARRVGDDVYVYRPVAPGDNVVHGGYDVLRGDVVVRQGTVLGPAELAVLAAVGVSKVRVYGKLKACVFSIGSELVAPGEKLELGRVYDINTFYLEGSLRELGVDVALKAILEDDESSVEKALRAAMEQCDVIITSGGTSAGVGDITYRVVERLGKPGIIFHGLKVRPGKPTFAAVVDGKLSLGLPGFPLSMAMIYNILVKPLIASVLGLRDNHLIHQEDATVLERILGYVGVERLVPVILRRKNGELVAYPLSYRSGSINILQLADGFIKVGIGVPYINCGEKVRVYRLHPRGAADLVVMGSHDYLLNALLSRVARDLTVKSVFVGSLAGLDAVAKGVADLAGIHVLDEETGLYNLPAIKKLGYHSKVALVIGYLREIGLMVAKGNPKNITSLEDLLRDDVSFVNRSKYSGTRVLVDLMLKRMAEERGVSFDELVSKIRGYFSEAKTHSGVAISVLTGRADVGVGLKYAAVMYGLDFIPLARERFDIAVSVDSLGTRGVKNVIEYMRSREFKLMARSYPGYELLDNTGDVVSLS